MCKGSRELLILKRQLNSEDSQSSRAWQVMRVTADGNFSPVDKEFAWCGGMGDYKSQDFSNPTELRFDCLAWRQLYSISQIIRLLFAHVVKIVDMTRSDKNPVPPNWTKTNSMTCSLESHSILTVYIGHNTFVIALNLDLFAIPVGIDVLPRYCKAKQAAYYTYRDKL